MSGSAPIILVLTLVAALAASASSGSDPGIVSIYNESAGGSVEWRQESVPVDRLLAIVTGPEALARIGAERAPIRQALAKVDVDFDTEVLLVAYMGAMPTGGYSIQVTNVDTLSDREGRPTGVALRLAVSSPAPDAMTTQALFYPVDLVKMSRDSWPEGLLDAVLNSEVGIEASDQDGRDWGPVIVYRGD